MSAAVTQLSAHNWFMQNLPEIQSRSNACLSRLSGERREDAQAEIIGAAFKATVHAERNGVLGNITAFHVVTNALKQCRQGRRMAGYTTTDVMSEATQLKGRCKVLSLSEPTARKSGERQCLPLSETLADRRQDNNPLEQVRRNLDYPEILRQEHVSPKARKVFKSLTRDRTTGHGLRLAHELMVSPGRITQLKGELAEALRRHDYTTV